jgi:hypothetical protein
MVAVYIVLMLPLLLLSAGLAAPEPPAGFVFVREAAGCSISMRDESHPQGVAMRAECSWPEVEAKAFGVMIQAYERYPEFVFPVTLARVERQEPQRTLVYQRQHVLGIADREVLLWMTREALPEGGVRVSWMTAPEEPLQIGPGTVRTPKNTGYWEVVPEPTGGSKVVHQIEMDAGGSVPRWLINLVRTSGFARLMGHIRVYAAELPRR